ncbi:hypothetical protein [Actinopolyspora mortivallis]|uniref:hypothetical protein n=1 Tax=Actinopolyspora mortivallis TaxID=33906 RepID=UPI0003791BB0|nr:hypothetical protein [Actinopolyspora mortivallis]
MRRTMMTLSALALVSTLGACGSPSQSASENGDNAQQSGENAQFRDVTKLASQASSTMDAKETVRMTIEVDGGALQGSPLAKTQNQSCQVDITNKRIACEGATSTVMTEDAIYSKIPEMGSAEKPWTKISMNSSDSGGMNQMGRFKQFSDIDSMLPPGSEITGESAEKVNGKQTTKYEVVTDPNKVVEQADGDIASKYGMLAENMDGEIRTTLWVDSEELPAKVETVSPPMTMMGQEIPETTTTVTYSDWGAPVDITVPPESKVNEF